MARTGIVTAMNSRRGMIAIQTVDDGYTIIELLSEWDLDVGDRISWTNDYGLGSEVYRNLTKNTHDEVYVQNHAVSLSALKGQLLLS